MNEQQTIHTYLNTPKEDLPDLKVQFRKKMLAIVLCGAGVAACGFGMVATHNTAHFTPVPGAVLIIGLIVVIVALHIRSKPENWGLYTPNAKKLAFDIIEYKQRHNKAKTLSSSNDTQQTPHINNWIEWVETRLEHMAIYSKQGAQIGLTRAQTAQRLASVLKQDIAIQDCRYEGGALIISISPIWISILDDRQGYQRGRGKYLGSVRIRRIGEDLFEAEAEEEEVNGGVVSDTVWTDRYWSWLAWRAT